MTIYILHTISFYVTKTIDKQTKYFKIIKLTELQYSKLNNSCNKKSNIELILRNQEIKKYPDQKPH